MLAAYVEQVQAEKAFQLYLLTQQDGVSPDACTIISALQTCRMFCRGGNGCCRGWSVHQSEVPRSWESHIHADAKKRAYGSAVFVGSILITLYGKCGSTADALKVFDGLSERDVVSWNAMLAAYVEQGQGDMGLQLCQQMQEQGMCPNEVTLVSLLQACSQTGSVAMLQDPLTCAGKQQVHGSDTGQSEIE